MKYKFIFLFIVCSFSVFSQENNNFKLNSIRIQYNGLANVERNATLPSLVRHSGFYNHYFGNYGVPERLISNKYYGDQIGINFGFKSDSYSKKDNHELLLGIGYQSSGEYTDRLTRNNYPRDSTNYDVDLAKIEIHRKYQEVYFNGSWLFKTNGKYFSVHTGLGFNISVSNPDLVVSEYELGILRNQYTIKNGFQAYYNVYLPMGFELKGKNLIFGFDYSVRYDNHFFSSVSFSLGYKI